MIKVNKHIEIVRSTTRGLSSMSKASCDAILAVLTQCYAHVGVTIINDSSDLKALASSMPDLVFLGMKFLPVDSALGPDDPDKIWLADYLDDHGIPYTGSGQAAHELELYKPLAKQRALDEGLETSPFYVVERGKPQMHDTSLSYPLFVKPTSRGGGAGIDSNSVAYNFSELHSKVRSIATSLQSDSLVEEYLPGREFSVALLKAEYSKEFLVMPIELIAQLDERGARLLSKQVKSSNTERAIEVADAITRSKVVDLALNIFHAMGARDYGRIDIRLDKAGTPHFLEANLIPSLISGYGSFPKACVLIAGMDYEPMILSIVRLALQRDPVLNEDDVEIITASSGVRPSLGAVL